MRFIQFFGLLTPFMISVQVFASGGASAQSLTRIENSSGAILKEVKPVRLMLSYGSELRPEQDVDSNFKDQVMENFSLGVGYQSFVFIFERAEFSQTTGNAALRLESRLEDDMLWAQYRAFSWHRIVPFVAAGAGIYKESVTTSLLGSSRTDQSDAKFLGGVSFGLSTDLPLLWLSVEARILGGDDLPQQLSLGALARIGVWF